MLRWWDHWLRGIDNGVMDEPPVTLYVQGARPGWRSFDSWPPAKDDVRLATATDTTLNVSTVETTPGTGIIGEYRSDPSIGATNGLWASAREYGMPLDQHHAARPA